MRILKTFIAMIFATSFLVACGGGAATESTTTAGTGGATATATEPALLTSYKKIKAGMTFDQVQAIIGTGYNFEIHEGMGRQYALWSQGTYQAPGSMTVQVAFGVSGGAENKYIAIKNLDGTFDPRGACATISAGTQCGAW